MSEKSLNTRRSFASDKASKGTQVKSVKSKVSKPSRAERIDIHDRFDELSFYMRQLEDGGARMRHYAAKTTYGVNADHVINNMINSIFPDCHDVTRKYILSGYTLGVDWEQEVLGYLQNDEIRVLSNELVFILFSLKMPVDDFLELSTLPKNYLAKLLPVGENV